MKTLLLTIMTWIAVILGVVGLGTILWGFVRMLRAGLSRRWPAVPGTIISSRVTQREGSRSEGSGPPPTLYRPEVKYRYAVGGRTYEGERVTLDDVETSNEGFARRVVERYRPGAQVSVHHAPADPERAVLEPGVHAGAWVLPGAGLALVLTAAGLGAAVRWWFMRK